MKVSSFDLDLVIELHPESVAKSFKALARVEELHPGLTVRLLRLVTLVQMKLEANRPKDQEDVANLKLIYGEDFQS